MKLIVVDGQKEAYGKVLKWDFKFTFSTFFIVQVHRFYSRCIYSVLYYTFAAAIGGNRSNRICVQY